MKNKLLYEKIVSSTNDRVKEIKINFKKSSSFGLISEKQLNGRGRKGNEWISQKGDLTCSFLINKSFNIKHFGKINIIISVIVCKVLAKEFPELEFKLKWPNDIFLKKKKIAGILIETSIIKKKIEYLIIGFGLNVVSEPVAKDYKTTSLKRYINEIDNNVIFKRIFKSLEKNLSEQSIKSFKNFKDYWISISKDIGKKIRVKKMNSFVTGVFETIDEDGSLVLNFNSQKEIVEF